MLSGRGLCDGLITRPEDSHRLCCIVVCDLETSCMRRPWSTGGGWGFASQTNKQTLAVTVTRIQAAQPKNCGSFLGRDKIVFMLYRRVTGCGGQLTSEWALVSSTGVKRLVGEVDH